MSTSISPASRNDRSATFRTVEVDGLRVFVREAGDRRAPAIVLLHGYPTSSHMFRELIPRLADHFHVIAPDMIGYGHSDAPPVDRFAYTFDHLADITRKLLDQLEVKSYLLYLHDFGGPVGMRLATAAPERLRGLIIQNANAYMEGVSQTVADLFLPLWAEQNERTLAAARGFLAADATRMQYQAGARDPGALDPTAWTLDQALLDRPGVAEAQLALFVDYQKNVALYEPWHAWFRTHQPRTLVLWGRNDPFFLAAGAEAYRRDLADAEVVLLDGGHFALEEYAGEVAGHILRTFAPAAPRQLAQAFYDQLAAGQLDRALALLSDDVSWNDPPGFPYGGRLTGPAQVKEQVFARIGADWERFAIVVDQLADVGPGAEARGQVLALGHYTGVHRATGRTLDVEFAHLWEGAGGRLTRFTTLTDTATLRDAMR